MWPKVFYSILQIFLQFTKEFFRLFYRLYGVYSFLQNSTEFSIDFVQTKVFYRLLQIFLQCSKEFYRFSYILCGVYSFLQNSVEFCSFLQNSTEFSIDFVWPKVFYRIFRFFQSFLKNSIGFSIEKTIGENPIENLTFFLPRDIIIYNKCVLLVTGWLQWLTTLSTTTAIWKPCSLQRQAPYTIPCLTAGGKPSYLSSHHNLQMV